MARDGRHLAALAAGPDTSFDTPLPVTAHPPVLSAADLPVKTRGASRTRDEIARMESSIGDMG